MMTAQQLHERNSKLALGYTAFVVALLFATMAKSNNCSRANVVICLFAASLPSLVTFVLLDYLVVVTGSTAEVASRKVAAVLGFLPSLIGIALVLAHFSIVAGALFTLITITWAVVIYVLAPKKSKN
jgi:hypothetical protein